MNIAREMSELAPWMLGWDSPVDWSPRGALPVMVEIGKLLSEKNQPAGGRILYLSSNGMAVLMESCERAYGGCRMGPPSPELKKTPLTANVLGILCVNTDKVVPDSSRSIIEYTFAAHREAAMHAPYYEPRKPFDQLGLDSLEHNKLPYIVRREGIVGVRMRVSMHEEFSKTEEDG